VRSREGSSPSHAHVRARARRWRRRLAPAGAGDPDPPSRPSPRCRTSGRIQSAMTWSPIGNGLVQVTSAPFFMPLCDTDRGLWAQTITRRMTAHLADSSSSSAALAGHHVVRRGRDPIS